MAEENFHYGLNCKGKINYRTTISFMPNHLMYHWAPIESKANKSIMFYLSNNVFAM